MRLSTDADSVPSLPILFPLHSVPMMRLAERHGQQGLSVEELPKLAVRGEALGHNFHS
jgi:hypothetical protein